MELWRIEPRRPLCAANLPVVGNVAEDNMSIQDNFGLPGLHIGCGMPIQASKNFYVLVTEQFKKNSICPVNQLLTAEKSGVVLLQGLPKTAPVLILLPGLTGGSHD